MPELDINVFAAIPPNDLEARRRAIMTKAAGQHDNLSIDELHELAAIMTILRRRASGPPKAKAVRTPKATRPTLEDLGTVQDFDTVDDIKDALNEGKIERGEAITALTEEFEMTEEDAIALVDTWPEEEADDA